jgi:hypothetical protein
METKQTAVEWLFEQVWLTPISELPKILEQAKEKEKHQIIEAYDMGNQNQYDKINIKDYININEEQYYNEIFIK